MSGSAKVACLCPEEERACCLPNNGGCILATPTDCVDIHGGTVPGQAACEPDPCNVFCDCAIGSYAVDLRLTFPGVCSEEPFEFSTVVAQQPFDVSPFVCFWDNRAFLPPPGGPGIDQLYCAGTCAVPYVNIIVNVPMQRARLQVGLGVSPPDPVNISIRTPPDFFPADVDGCLVTPVTRPPLMGFHPVFTCAGISLNVQGSTLEVVLIS